MMPIFIVNASCKVYFDREIAVVAESKDDAIEQVQQMLRTGQIPLPQLPDEVDGWEVGETDLLPDQRGGGFWSAYLAESAG
jgi:hypothetical protein